MENKDICLKKSLESKRKQLMNSLLQLLDSEWNPPSAIALAAFSMFSVDVYNHFKDSFNLKSYSEFMEAVKDVNEKFPLEALDHD